MSRPVATERRQAYVPLCDFVAELTLARWPSLTVVPFFDEMFSKVSDGGPQELVEMPADYWREIGAIGTIDDAHEHIAALDAVGVEHVAVFSARQLDDPWDLIPLVAELNRR